MFPNEEVYLPLMIFNEENVYNLSQAGNYSANLRVTINHLGLLQWNILNESNDEWTTMYTVTI